MNNNPLPRDFYLQPVVEVARALLGCILVHHADQETLSGRIVETEAYSAAGDESCHAYRGRTIRNASMFGPSAHAYVYRSYGLHYCLNVVTTPPGNPASAVLLRALEPMDGLAAMRGRRPGRADADLLRGPGNLCRALGIGQALDGVDLLGPQLVILPAAGQPDAVVVTTRIGITRSADLPWRFYILGSPSVSRPARAAEARQHQGLVRSK